MKGEHILVTGGAGAIGSNLVRVLLDRGHNLSVVDNLSSGRVSNLPESKRLVFYPEDVGNERILKKIFNKNVDRVFHLAAFFANQNSIENPEQDLRTNILGTLRLLNHSKSVRSFLLVSTSCFYEKSKLPMHEEMDCHFETPYAISKYTSERYALFYYDFYKLPVVIVRYFNSYGPNEYPGLYRNVIPNFFYRALKKKPLVITGTGDEARSFTFVGDIVDGTIKAAYSGLFGEIFNIGNPRATRIEVLARLINKITKNPAGIVYKERREWDKTLSKRCSIDKAKRVLGYAPKTPLEEGLGKTYKWFLEKIHGMKP